METVFPALLGEVHGRIGTVRQFLKVLAVDREDADPDAGGKCEDALPRFDRLAQRIQQALRHAVRKISRSRFNEQDVELISARSGHHVAASDAFPESLRNGFEHRVTDGVAQRIVNQLKPIQIDEEQCQCFLGLFGALDRFVESLAELAPVRQAGQWVVKGLVGQLILNLLPVLYLISQVHIRVQATVRGCSGKSSVEIQGNRQSSRPERTTGMPRGCQSVPEEAKSVPDMNDLPVSAAGGKHLGVNQLFP